MNLAKIYINGGEDFYKFIQSTYINNGISINSEIDKFLCYLIFLSQRKNPFFVDHLKFLDQVDWTKGNNINDLNNFKLRIVNSSLMLETHRYLSIFVISSILNDKSLIVKEINFCINQRNTTKALFLYRVIRYISENNTFKLPDFFKASYERELLKMIQEEVLKLNNLSYTKTLRKEVRSVVFLIAYIPPNFKTGAHLSQIVWLTEALSKYENLNVTIFVTGENSTDDYLPYRPINIHLYNKMKNLLCDIDKNVNFVCFKDFSSKKYITNILHELNKANPDVIVKLGGALESKILDKYLYCKYPTVYRQFNLYNKPDSEYDLYLSQGDTSIKMNNSTQWFRSPIPLMYELISDDDIKKKISNNKTTIFLITVLGNGRIEDTLQKYTKEENLLLTQILELNIHWTFIGVKNKLFFETSEVFKKYSNKLTILNYHPSLNEVYQKHDIFVMLPHFTGGGGGATMAAASGLSILTYNTSDASNFTPSDYVFSDYVSFFNYLQVLIQNKDERIKNINAVLNEIKERNVNKVGKKLVELFYMAINNFDLKNKGIQ